MLNASYENFLELLKRSFLHAGCLLGAHPSNHWSTSSINQFICFHKTLLVWPQEEHRACKGFNRKIPKIHSGDRPKLEFTLGTSLNWSNYGKNGLITRKTTLCMRVRAWEKNLTTRKFNSTRDVEYCMPPPVWWRFQRMFFHRDLELWRFDPKFNAFIYVP